MKKARLALMFVLMFLCVGLAFSLTSCGDDDGEHTHTPNSAVRENEIAATCASAGSYDEVVYCAECSEEISRTSRTIEKLSHTPSEWITDTEATCKAEGVKHKECTVCHTELETDKIDKLTTHTPAEAVRENEVDSSCSKVGSYDEVVYCSVCEIELSREEKEIGKLPHTEVIDKAKAPTCTETGLTEGKHCFVCNEVITAQEMVKANGHTDENSDYTCDICTVDLCTEHEEETIPAVPATCTETGLTEGKKCSICGDILVAQEIVKANGHTEVIDVAKAPTCTETGLTEGKHCSVCSTILVKQETVDALGHTEVTDAAKAPNCTETGLTEGKHCSVCSTVLVAQEVVKANGHTEVVDKAKAPTCTETGLTEGKHCSVCSTVLVAQEVVKANGHTEVVDEAKAPTCTETGLTEGKHCSVCSTVLVAQEVVKANGHTEVIDEAVEATETSDGLTEGKHCEVCGEILVAQQTIPATLQGTAIKSELLTVDGDRIYGSVSNTTTIFSFLNDITVNGNASYILSRDIECENEITSKTVGISIGDNIFYILVTNGKNAKLYTVTLRRLPMYTVSFNTNGGTELETISFEEGDFEYPETSKSGYNLDGWKVNGNLVSFPYTVTENTEFEAVFSPIVYDITYELNGGVNAEENPDSYTIETSTITLGMPTRDYYDFCGWYDNSEFAGDAVTQIALGSVGDVVLYAKWTPTVYEIKYNLDGGINAEGNPASYTVESDTIAFANPTRVGYMFKGWFVNEACTESITEISHGSHGKVEIYAKWEAIVYDIGYELNGGVNAENNPDTYTIETNTITLSAPARNYYDFAGWYDNAEFAGDAVTQIALGSISDVVLYAKWTPTVYEIKYNLDGGENNESNPENYTIESNVIAFAEPIRAGYAFICWYTDEDCTNSITGILHGSHGEVEIYAKWEAIYVVSGNSIMGLTDYAKTNVTELDIPSAIDGAEITSIGSSAFEGCTSLTSVTIPDSITTIGEDAFYECTSLTSVYIKDIAAWCEISFGPNFANPVYYANNLYLNGKLVVDLVIPDSVTSIGDWAFRGCSSLANLTIPDNVTSIGSFAFIGCTNLASVTIGKGVTSIDDCAFRDCTNLTNITIDATNPIYQSIDGNLYNKDATKLINYAFGKDATSFAVPNTVTSIGDWAFHGCTSLASVTIPNSVRSIGDYAFADCDSLTSIVIPDSVISIGSQVFCDCDRLASATIGNGITNISTQAFSYCRNLTSITIPDSVTSIGDWAFHDCSNLTVIELPDSLTSIGDYAFSGCYSLTSIVIPDGVTSISNYTFSDCHNLTIIVISDSVTSIGDCAFYYCDSLTNIKYRGTEEQWSAISKSWNWNYNSGLYYITYNYADE